MRSHLLRPGAALTTGLVCWVELLGIHVTSRVLSRLEKKRWWGDGGLSAAVQHLGQLLSSDCLQGCRQWASSSLSLKGLEPRAPHMRRRRSSNCAPKILPDLLLLLSTAGLLQTDWNVLALFMSLYAPARYTHCRTVNVLAAQKLDSCFN